MCVHGFNDHGSPACTPYPGSAWDLGYSLVPAQAWSLMAAQHDRRLCDRVRAAQGPTRTWQAWASCASNTAHCWSWTPSAPWALYLSMRMPGRLTPSTPALRRCSVHRQVGHSASDHLQVAGMLQTLWEMAALGRVQLAQPAMAGVVNAGMLCQSCGNLMCPVGADMIRDGSPCWQCKD